VAQVVGHPQRFRRYRRLRTGIVGRFEHHPSDFGWQKLADLGGVAIDLGVGPVNWSALGLVTDRHVRRRHDPGDHHAEAGDYKRAASEPGPGRKRGQPIEQ
jgi:hypothetical protein